MPNVIYPKRSHFIICMSLGFQPAPALQTLLLGGTRLIQAQRPSAEFLRRELFKVK